MIASCRLRFMHASYSLCLMFASSCKRGITGPFTRSLNRSVWLLQTNAATAAAAVGVTLKIVSELSGWLARSCGCDWCAIETASVHQCSLEATGRDSESNVDQRHLIIDDQLKRSSTTRRNRVTSSNVNWGNPFPPLVFSFLLSLFSLSLKSKTHKIRLGVWGNVVSFPSGVWGRAPAAVELQP